MSLAVDNAEPAAPPAPLPGRDYPWYTPRFWHGMRLGDWLSLAGQYRWRVHPARWGMAFSISCVTAANSSLRLVQQTLYGQAIERTEITEPPVFILGHWRSGTTYLHELMMRDERFTTPTSYQCFAPHHLLISEWLVTRMFWWLMPGKRPMDNVALGWNTPQEDEFALCAMNTPSPYRNMAFPNEPRKYFEYLDMEGLSDEELERWRAALLWFVKEITYHAGRRVLLKSPPHTGRVKVLSEMFPGAKFIHLVREPYSLYSSTVKLWKTLNYAQGLQLSEGRDVEEYSFRCLEQMYSGLHRQRTQIDPQSICDVRYEELIRDPVGRLRAAYEELGLDGFDAVEPKLSEYAASKRDYQPNRHRLDETVRDEVARRWGFYFERYGYEV